MENRSFSKLQDGALVLADISGYTAFVAQTEIDHSWEILHELLDTMVRTVEGRMDVSQVEGDCILFISGLSDADVVAALEDTFVSFHRRLRDMQSVTTCPCNACANIGILKLKFVVHRGTFSRQRLGAVEQLHGTDVIVAHRLLKNKVPSKEYILATESVRTNLPTERQSRFTPYSEVYDLGSVSGGYEEIAYLWDAALTAERKRVVPEEALIDDGIVVDAPIAQVVESMLVPEVMARYLMADSVDAFAGARGSQIGGEFHCHHGTTIRYLRVVSVEPGRETTLVSSSPVGDMYITTRFEEVGDQTAIRRLFWWHAPADEETASTVRQMIEAVVAGGGAELQAIFAESPAAR
ncbi:MAG TPA: DUF2652 domain-containing protein [Candidatus Dormibacteraeota bacterium]|nr:DUF2652 domain-containing protein [Candidatus Dormibacteraeota bacterium]